MRNLLAPQFMRPRISQALVLATSFFLCGTFIASAPASELRHTPIVRAVAKAEMVEMYEHDANWQDDEAGVRRRRLR